MIPATRAMRAAARRRTSTTPPVHHGTDGTMHNSGAANVILTVPPETLIGDLLLVGAMDAFSGSSSVSVGTTGFTQAGNGNDAAGDLAALVAWKFAVASDVQTGLGGSASSSVQYSFPLGGTHKALGWMGAVTGVNAAPINGQSTFSVVDTGTTAQTYPNATPAVDNTLVFGFLFYRNGTSGKTDNAVTTPGGWTELADLQSGAAGSVNGCMQVIMQTNVTAGTVTGPSVTLVNSSKALLKTVPLAPV